MKRKELKNIAKQIAKYERIIQATDDKNLRHDAENAIIQLSNNPRLFGGRDLIFRKKFDIINT